MRTLRRVIGLVLVTLLVGVWAITLRPQAIGGPAVFIVVRGSSMLPTYEHGDLVVVESAARYSVGDAVAYRVPQGQVGAGNVVIHRIVGGDGSRGYVLQGDNNSAPDPWLPKRVDMVGVATIRLPHFGSLIRAAGQPVILAGLAAAIVVMLMLARPARPGGPTPAS